MSYVAATLYLLGVYYVRHDMQYDFESGYVSKNQSRYWPIFWPILIVIGIVTDVYDYLSTRNCT